jgi:hypothetical protein
MIVTLTLNAGQGVSLGPVFNLTADVGVVSPHTVTLTQLLAGLEINVDIIATEVIVQSTGNCTNSLTIPIVPA